MRVLLVSTYELGHQPLHVASPAAALLAAGHDVRALDLSVEAWNPHLVGWADAVAISVPMHTAMRLGVEVARRVRNAHPEMPVAMYGLYAGMGADRVIGAVADRAIVGEYEPGLVAWASDPVGGVRTDLGVGRFEIPARRLLPPLENYAHLSTADGHRTVGYIEASHGCRHRCRHCPIPAVYDGVFRIVGLEPILADVDQLVGMGAEHVTIGDPDFLNGPAHALRVLDALHERHPSLTFDVTVKVEHLLEHRRLLERLAGDGVIFVVSAFETTDSRSLELLDKGHRAEDLPHALDACREVGIDVHPSWMPFMPWTVPNDVLDVFRFLDRHDLLAVTDPVQLSIRLLVPEGSLVLALPEFVDGGYDAELLGHRWASADPAADVLQADLAKIAAEGADAAEDPAVTLTRMWSRCLEMAGAPAEDLSIPAGATAGRPRMTEPWFC